MTQRIVTTPKRPAVKSPSWGVVLIIWLLVAALALFTVLILQATTAKKRQSLEKKLSDPIVATTADKLCDMYENNPVLMEQAKDSAITVSGTINDIDIDILGKPYITVGKGILGAVRCTFEKTNGNTVAKLKKGQHVTVKGILEGRDPTGQVQLISCKLSR